MSYQEGLQPTCESAEGQVVLEIRPNLKDLGEFSVRRVLPASERQMIGPFIFFDHMGPAEFPPGQGIQVRPHPHIGIATITYLFEGEIMHRDSLGQRHISWNFVSSSRERIEEARQEWAAGGFSRVAGDDEFIPLPG